LLAVAGYKFGSVRKESLGNGYLRKRTEARFFPSIVKVIDQGIEAVEENPVEVLA